METPTALARRAAASPAQDGQVQVQCRAVDAFVGAHAPAHLHGMGIQARGRREPSACHGGKATTAHTGMRRHSSSTREPAALSRAGPIQSISKITSRLSRSVSGAGVLLVCRQLNHASGGLCRHPGARTTTVQSTAPSPLAGPSTRSSTMPSLMSTACGRWHHKARCENAHPHARSLPTRGQHSD